MKLVHKNRRKPQGRKAKRTVDCPAKLAEEIERVNLLPARIDYYSDISPIFVNVENNHEAIITRLQEKIPGEEGLRLFEYLRFICPPRIEEPLRFMQFVLEELSRSRFWLRTIAKKAERVKKSGSKRKDLDFSAFNTQNYIADVINAKDYREYMVWLHPILKQDGKLTLELPAYIQATVGEEAWRIRQCPICKKIFWAGRKDKSACTGSCTNVFWVKKSAWYQNRAREAKRRMKAAKKRKVN